ncbi:MAG: fibronectin type III domain-containing protein [Cyclobacteriaceae bacterium]
MKHILLFLAVIFGIVASAQVFPVQVNPQLIPPYSPYLSDYTAPGAQNFIVHIRANDISLTDYPCKLRITIEGVGITIRTKENFIAQPIRLEGGGVPQIFYGEDLWEYFLPNALEFSGFSRSEYEKRAKLPEGVYRFSVEVLDYNRSTVVSNKGTTTAWIILNDPPMLNLPTNFSKLKLQDPTNILFTWTPRHTASPNAAFTTEYTFRLLEVWPENRNPYDAFLTQPPLFEIVISQTQIIYGPGEPSLIPGRKYAWQVEARDTGGKDLFKNKGRSEVYVFQYGEALPVPQNLQMRWAKPTTLAIRWDRVTVVNEDVKYRLQYRPRQRSENHDWYETRTMFTEKTLYHLQTNTEYELRVRTETDGQESDYTEIEIFKTLPPEEEVFVCKDVAPPDIPENTLPVFPLSINDTIKAGGYDVLVRDVMEVNGKYYGSGLAIVPWFNSAKVRVTFENIRVNDGFWLTAGTIKSVWNPESRFLLEAETPITPGKAPQTGELDVNIVATDSLITVEGMSIASVTKDEAGNIVVTTTDGNQKTLPKGESYAIVDEVGNGYVVDEKGNITKTTATAARGSGERGRREYDLSFNFSKGDGRFGFDEMKHDALSKYYQQLEDGSHVPWKALSVSFADDLEGALQAGTDITRIRFEAGSTPLAPAKSLQGKFTFSLQAKAAGIQEELLALYSPSDTLPDKVLGKINLAHYNHIYYDLEIIPVNEVSLPEGLNAELISQSLNAVYNQAVVQWNVKLSRGIQVALEESFDDGETGLFSNYTSDMKKVLDAFDRFQDNTYYLFLIDRPKNPSTLGYMPRGKQAGFVFVKPHEGNSDEFLKTLAHELGHGAFNLKHIFSEHSLPPGTTDNVMDYSNGKALYKYQWDYIHEPQSVIGLFEGEEGGMNSKSSERFYQNAAPLLEDPGFKHWVEKFRKVNAFLKACNTEGWKSYNGVGIIPHCFWANQNVSPTLYYSNLDLPFTAGLIDGTYLEAAGIYHLPKVLEEISNFPGKVLYAYTVAYWECGTEKLISSLEEYEFVVKELAVNEKEVGLWNWVKEQWHDYKGEKEDLEKYFIDCKEADEVRQVVEELYELSTNWDEIRNLSSQVCDRLKEYWSSLKSTDNGGRYQRGALIIPAASVILPLGVASKVEHLKDALKVLKETSDQNWNKFVGRIGELTSSWTPNRSKLSTRLIEVYDDLFKSGYKVYDEGEEILISTADNTLVAKIADDELHIKIPERHGIWAKQSSSEYAISALENVKNGSPLYRIGTLNRSSAAEAQYWSLENPLNIKDIKTFAKKYGIPEDNLKSGEFFLEIGKPKQSSPIISREAPAFENNPGGGIEIVVPSNSVGLESFHIIKF